MSAGGWSLRRIHCLAEADLLALPEVLIDCVEGGACVSFAGPYSCSSNSRKISRPAPITPRCSCTVARAAAESERR
jgi:hypothetical protein